ncbi:MAG: twin-arginine translocase subunit TatC [Bacteroidia bacterium]|nr:twin-arginine translocase subunit TatC [Bacteroidia bacterium]
MSLDQPKDNDSEEKKEMTFFDHIDELRGHLFRSVVAILIAAVTAFLNKHILFDIIIFGPMRIDFLSYRVLCKLSYWAKGTDEFCMKSINFELKNIDMTGQFTQHLWIAFIAGIIIAFPYILWQLWSFIKPALSKKEISYARGLVFFSSMLFFSGIGFGYFFLSPVSITFMGSYQVSELVNNEINLESYISFISTITMACGLMFEMPILVYFLVKIGILSAKIMSKYRKHALVIILIVAGILTPSPDMASQILMAIPLYALFESSIFVARRVEKNKSKSKI